MKICLSYKQTQDNLVLPLSQTFPTSFFLFIRGCFTSKRAKKP